MLNMRTHYSAPSNENFTNLPVHSIDASEVGVAKTLKLASERGVVIHASQGTQRANITAVPSSASHCPIAFPAHNISGFLEDLNLAPNSIDTFVSIFCHSEPVSSAPILI